MATITVLDSTGATQTLNAPNANGQATAANSRSVVHASDDNVVVATGAQTDTAWATGNGSIIALLKSIASQALSTVASLISGTATTSAPTYTNGTNNALSLNLTGGLRVDGSGVTQPVSLASTTVSNTVTVSGAVAVSNASLAVTGSFFQTTQPVSGTITVGNASLPVTGTFFQATQPVSLASTTITGTVATSLASTTITGSVAITAAALPLPTGAAADSSVTALSAKFGALGQGLMAASAPVVIASNQSAIPVSNATLPLPTGASTETTLAALSAKHPAALGSTTKSASMSVAAATDDYARQPSSNFFVLPAAAASNNLTLVKGSAGAIKTIQGYNAKTSAVRLKLFNAASTGAVTPGTTAATKSIYLPPSSAFVFDYPSGVSCSSGIVLMLTTGSSLTDNTAVAVNDVTDLNVDYI